ncbi:MAG: hypothetical protein V8S27_01310 [Lachnospiraceae bacterium]
MTPTIRRSRNDNEPIEGTDKQVTFYRALIVAGRVARRVRSWQRRSTQERS